MNRPYNINGYTPVRAVARAAPMKSTDEISDEMKSTTRMKSSHGEGDGDICRGWRPRHPALVIRKTKPQQHK